MIWLNVMIAGYQDTAISMEFPDVNRSLGIHKLTKTATQECSQENKMANGKKTNTDTGKSIGIRTQKQPRHECRSQQAKSQWFENESVFEFFESRE